MSSYTKEQSPVQEIFIPALKGFAVSVIAAAVLLFGLTAVAYAMQDPDSMTAPLGYGALYLSAAVAGIFAARQNGDTGGTAVLSAAVAGVLMLVLLILMSFLPAESRGETSPIISVLMYAAVPAVSALGGLLFRRRPSRRMKHKRRR